MEKEDKKDVTCSLASCRKKRTRPKKSVLCFSETIIFLNFVTKTDTMQISVANPIYDSVFKFLMEDERIARTVLSALLKKEIISVEMRRHEHPNITRDNLSMFRIDFAARIKEDDGKEHLVLIELQKTWLDTETLRFRRYLAAQYNAEENMQKEGDRQGYAFPMVAVYLLGHRIGDIDKPVVYVGHKALDYYGAEVANGDKDPFINSLIHDSIIVQIPLLHGKINNRLDKVLSVFDQTQRDSKNQQIISLDETLYENDPDMMHLIHRLSLATMSAAVRQEMNDEDEFYSVIEARDTQVMRLNKQLSEQKEQLSKQTEQLSKQTEQLSKQTEQLSEQKEQLSKQTEQLSEQKEQLSKQTEQLSKQTEQLSKQTEQLSKQTEQLSKKDEQIKAMAQTMFQNGVPMNVIAQTMGQSVEEVKATLGLLH